jgi:lipopolysaccharide transport system ATP-binding protein
MSGSEESWRTPESAPGNDKVRLKRVAVVSDVPITVATPFSVEVEFWNYLNGAMLNVAIEVFNQDEICAFSSFSRPKEFFPGVVKAVCRVPGNLLNNSLYRIKVLLVRDAREQLLVHDSVMFEAHDVEREVAYFGKWTGVVRPTLNWTIEATVSDDVCVELQA